ncbi:MAG: helix-turn-helix transcriptional regulator [Calditrichaeota bacterium]|nr:helix-turn-helix transcriptional regulator [Calditrichota bacterium]
MEAVLYIGLSQAFFASFVIATKKPRCLPDKILASWLFLIGLEMTISLCLLKIAHFFIPFPTSMLLLLTYAPLLFLYVKSLIRENTLPDRKDWLHFLPFILFLAAYFLFLWGDPVFLVNNYFAHDASLPFRLAYSIYLFLSVIIYSVLVLFLISEHQKKLKDEFSYTSQTITLNWLKIVLFIFVITFLSFIITGTSFMFQATDLDPRWFSRIGLTLFAFAVSYFGIKQPTLFKSNCFPRVEKKSDQRQKNRYERSGLNEELAKNYSERLQHFMKEGKPYLNPELTIKDVSDHLNISRHYITQVLNETMKKNFYTFINEYRVEEVKKRLVDHQYDHLTFSAIAYECGFNSKSSFNFIFKKSTGMTPSEFKKKRMESRQ